MSHPDPSSLRPKTASLAPHSPRGDDAVDSGLRSLRGIRWLLLVGALVAAVSVVRLLAAQWGFFSPSIKFLILVSGALTVYTAGDVLRHRWHLPVAGSALLFLFTGMVPLLAWGAAYSQLLAEPFGWPTLALGLTGLLAATRGVLDRALDYRSLVLPGALGVMLVALSALPRLAERWPGREDDFFVIAAIAFGLVLRAAGRHVNRFLFHRDRVRGIERPASSWQYAAPRCW